MAPNTIPAMTEGYNFLSQVWSHSFVVTLFLVSILYFLPNNKNNFPFCYLVKNKVTASGNFCLVFYVDLKYVYFMVYAEYRLTFKHSHSISWPKFLVTDWGFNEEYTETKIYYHWEPIVSQEIMTVEELAKYLDLAESTIYQKVHENSIPYTKMKNLLRFPKQIIDEWLLKNTVYPDEKIFEEFARWHSRYLFKAWLKSRGKKPEEVSGKELSELARRSLSELLEQGSWLVTH